MYIYASFYVEIFHGFSFQFVKVFIVIQTFFKGGGVMTPCVLYKKNSLEYAFCLQGTCVTLVSEY
jgi:hypothetical protein